MGISASHVVACPGLRAPGFRGPIIELCDFQGFNERSDYLAWIATLPGPEHCRKIEHILELPAFCVTVPEEFRKPTMLLEHSGQREETPASNGWFVGRPAPAPSSIEHGAAAAQAQASEPSDTPIGRQSTQLLGHANQNGKLSAQAPSTPLKPENMNPIPPA